MLRTFRGVLPTVDPTAFVDASAQVIGDVHIGAESSIWMNAVIRGDVHWIRIGARTNVQDGSIVHVQTGAHPTTVGDEVTVGHGAIVHGSTIEDRCLIGMGAILLNGVQVGTESIVAADPLFTSKILGTPIIHAPSPTVPKSLATSAAALHAISMRRSTTSVRYRCTHTR